VGGVSLSWEAPCMQDGVTHQIGRILTSEVVYSRADHAVGALSNNLTDRIATSLAILGTEVPRRKSRFFLIHNGSLRTRLLSTKVLGLFLPPSSLQSTALQTPPRHMGYMEIVVARARDWQPRHSRQVGAGSHQQGRVTRRYRACSASQASPRGHLPRHHA